MLGIYKSGCPIKGCDNVMEDGVEPTSPDSTPCGPLPTGYWFRCCYCNEVTWHRRGIEFSALHCVECDDRYLEIERRRFGYYAQPEKNKIQYGGI